MKLEKLTKKEAKLAEQETTPIINLASNPPQKENKDQKELRKSISKMFDWKYTKNHNFRKDLGTTKQNKDHIIKSLGKPLYHSHYEYREAVWGFKLDEVRIICYYSTRGFSVQIDEECAPSKANKILRLICQELEK